MQRRSKRDAVQALLKLDRAIGYAVKNGLNGVAILQNVKLTVFKTLSTVERARVQQFRSTRIEPKAPAFFKWRINGYEV